MDTATAQSHAHQAAQLGRAHEIDGRTRRERDDALNDIEDRQSAPRSADLGYMNPTIAAELVARIADTQRRMDHYWQARHKGPEEANMATLVAHRRRLSARGWTIEPARYVVYRVEDGLMHPDSEHQVRGVALARADYNARRYGGRYVVWQIGENTAAPLTPEHATRGVKPKDLAPLTV